MRGGTALLVPGGRIRHARDRPEKGAMRTDAIPALARAAIDTATHRRVDREWLDKAWSDPSTRVLVLDGGPPGSRGWSTPSPRRSRSLVTTERPRHLALTSPERAPEGERYFLGVDDGAAHFAVRSTEALIEPEGTAAATLGEIGAFLGDRDTGLLTPPPPAPSPPPTGPATCPRPPPSARPRVSATSSVSTTAPPTSPCAAPRPSSSPRALPPPPSARSARSSATATPDSSPGPSPWPTGTPPTASVPAAAGPPGWPTPDTCACANATATSSTRGPTPPSSCSCTARSRAARRFCTETTPDGRRNATPSSPDSSTQASHWSRPSRARSPRKRASSWRRPATCPPNPGRSRAAS